MEPSYKSGSVFLVALRHGLAQGKKLRLLRFDRAPGEETCTMEGRSKGGIEMMTLDKLRATNDVAALIGRLRSDLDSGARAYAADLLAEIGDPAAVQALIEALGDQDVDVADAAATALGGTGDSRAVLPLVEILERKPYVDSCLRENAALQLGRIGDARAKPALVRALRDLDEEVRFYAVEVLWQFLA